jgi:glycosyltransferase involved in cell wall biosynthesis
MAARICFISKRVVPAEQEGPHQRAVRSLIPALVNQGNDVHIVGTEALPPEWDPTTEFSPARVVALGKSRVRYAISAFRGYVNRERPDICIGLVPGLYMFSVIATSSMQSKPACAPWEATPFVYDIPSFRLTARTTYPPLMRRLYPRAATILGVSTDCIETLDRLGIRIDGIPQAVIPYPIRVDEVENWAERDLPDLPMAGWEHLIVAAGRLDPQKGHDVLLRAIAELRSAGFDVGVVILGEGGSRTALETLVRRLNLDKCALLPGDIRPPHRLYRMATVFVHPSRWEGFGMSLLEAMAVGSPVIATSCPGGPKEILDGGRYGVLVPPDDPLALATEIESLIRDERARLEMARLARLRADAYAPSVVAGVLGRAIARHI